MMINNITSSAIFIANRSFGCFRSFLRCELLSPATLNPLISSSFCAVLYQLFAPLIFCITFSNFPLTTHRFTLLELSSSSRTLICSLLQEAHYMIFRTFYGIIIAYFYKNFILSIAFHKIVRFSHDLVRRLF